MNINKQEDSEQRLKLVLEGYVVFIDTQLFTLSSPLTRYLATVPLLPLLMGVLGGIGSAELIASSWWWACGVAMVLCIFLPFKNHWESFIIAGFILGAGSHGYVLKKQHDALAVVVASDGALAIEMTAKVIDLGSSGVGPYIVKVKQASEPLLPTGVKIALTTSRATPSALKRGDLIEVSGILKPIPPRRNPHGFEPQQWRHRQGANLTLHNYQNIIPYGQGMWSQPAQVLETWREHLRGKITLGLEPDSTEAQIIRAIVLGEKPPHTIASSEKSQPIMENFRLSGTLHVFAVSGLHVGMVALIIHTVLIWLGVPRGMKITVTILGMVLYAAITGLNPPAVRATLMGTILLTGFLLQRKSLILNSLLASAIIVLLYDGHQLFTAGFQLSYGVLLSIALTYHFWEKRFHPFGEIDPFMPRVLLTQWQQRGLASQQKLRGSLAVSISAAAGSAPLLWWHFGIVTPISILAGIPMMLLVFGILSLAFLSLTLGSLIPPVGKWINHTNAFLATAAFQTSGSFASIPGAHWQKKSARHHNGQVIVFDIPYGGAAQWVDLGGGILLDSGSVRHFKSYVLPTLTAYQAEPDSLIVSHADVLHSGNMSHCLDLYQPQQALIPRRDYSSPSYRDFLENAAASSCNLITPTMGQRFPIEEGIFIEVLQAPAELTGKGSADDSGLILRLHWHGWRILFTADAGIETETRLLASGVDLSSDVIITGRNKDGFTGSEAFYRAVAPSAIIASNSSFSEGEQIPAAWYATTQKLDIQVLDQLQTGAVTITLKNDTLILTPTLPELNPVILKR